MKCSPPNEDHARRSRVPSPTHEGVGKVKEHSGNGKANNNNLDPTLDEHKAAGGHHEPARVPGDADAIGTAKTPPGKVGERGRGETDLTTPAAPIDI